MKLISIETKNFKRLGTRTINLTNGLNAVTGPNGFGKTTIIEAFLTCLYGTSQVRGSATSLKTRNSEGSWKLSTTFKLANSFYKSSCSASTAELVKAECSEFKNPEVVARGRSDVTASVTNLLGSAESFKFLHVIEQKDAADIARSGGIRLQRQVERQTGADVLQKVEEWCKGELNRIDAVLGHRDAVVGHELTSLKEKKASVEHQLAQIEKKKAQVKKGSTVLDRRDKAVDDLNKARIEMQGYLTREGQIATAKAKLTATQDNIVTLERERKRIGVPELVTQKEIQDASDRMLEIDSKLREAREVEDMIEQKQQEILDNNRRVAEVEAKIQSWSEVEEPDEEVVYATDSEQAKLADDLDGMTSNFSELTDKLDQTRRDVKHLKSEIKTLEDQRHATHCPTCKQSMPEITPEYIEEIDGKVTAAKLRLEDLQEVEGKLDGEVGELSALIQQQTQLVRAKRAELHDLQESADKYDRAQTEIAGLLDVLADLQKFSVSIPEKIDSRPLHQAREQLVMELSDLNNRRTEYDRTLERIKSLDDRIESDSKVVRKLVKELDSIHLGDKPNLERLELIANEATKLANEYEAEARDIEQGFDRLTAELASVSEALAKVESEAERMEGMRERRSVAASLITYVKSRRSDYLSQVWSAICSEASRVAEQITDGIVNSAGQSTTITDIRREGDSFICLEGGHEVSIKELSGAQEDVAGIAVKLAVSKILNPGSGFLIMDEPTSAMSSVIGTRCVSVIGSMSGQVVTVTHKEDEIRSAANVVELG